MPKEDETDAEALEADVNEADDRPADAHHFSEVDALLLAPHSDQSARDLIIEEDS